MLLCQETVTGEVGNPGAMQSGTFSPHWGDNCEGSSTASVPYFPEPIHPSGCGAPHRCLVMLATQHFLCLLSSWPGTCAPTHAFSPRRVWARAQVLEEGLVGKSKDDWRGEQKPSRVSQTVGRVLCLCVVLFP